jgi:hypothetical protein
MPILKQLLELTSLYHLMLVYYTTWYRGSLMRRQDIQHNDTQKYDNQHN